MASKKSEAKPKSDVYWVSVELTTEQTAHMKQVIETADAVLEYTLKLVEAGYKVSLSWDYYQGSHVCWVIPTDKETTNGGCILSNRGRTPFSALRGAIYRHFWLFDGDWGDRNKRDWLDED